ncbi:hypothetical protein IMY05_C4372000400 [Salix suchowensis]|nr:hypothetical protein IMY05_C4372000400 [Salix suchowensis]
MKGERRSRGVDAPNGTKMGSWVNHTKSRRTTTKGLGCYAYPHNRRSLGLFVLHDPGTEIQKLRAPAHFMSELTLSIIHAIPMFSLFTKQASRKYLDLIYGVSSKWANWDRRRSSKCQYPIPGDFGVIDSGSGQFEKEGYILVDFAADETVCQIVSQYPPTRLPSPDNMSSAPPKVNGNSTRVGAPCLSWTDQDDRDSGSPLDSPCRHRKAEGEILDNRSVLVPRLRALSVQQMSVTDVDVGGSCSQTPNKFDAVWICEGGTGLFQKAYREEACSTPLYQAKTIRKHRAARVEPDVYVVRAYPSKHEVDMLRIDALHT